MNRFQYLSQAFFDALGVRRHTLGLEMGSSAIRLVSGGKVIQEKPSLSMDNPGYHPTVPVVPLVEKGIVTNIPITKKILTQMISELDPSSSFITQYIGLCVLPSSVTPLEIEITKSSLPVRPGLSWKMIPRTIVHAASLKKRFADTGMITVLDIGSEVTELSVMSNLEASLVDISDKKSKQNSVSETLFWGTKDLERHLQMVIRDVYQVQLSQEAFRTLFYQLGDTLFNSHTKAKTKFAVRAQSLASGRPITVTLEAAELQPAFLDWYEYLKAGLQVSMQKQESWFSQSLEQGVVVVGGGAAIADLVPELSHFLSVPTTTTPKPRNWTVEGLQLLTKE